MALPALSVWTQHSGIASFIIMPSHTVQFHYNNTLDYNTDLDITVILWLHFFTMEFYKEFLENDHEMVIFL